MVRAKTSSADESRVVFTYDKCYGMSVTNCEVDKEWFDTQDTDNLSPEELHELARADKENSKVDSVTRWWGLG